MDETAFSLQSIVETQWNDVIDGVGVDTDHQVGNKSYFQTIEGRIEKNIKLDLQQLTKKYIRLGMFSRLVQLDAPLPNSIHVNDLTDEDSRKPAPLMNLPGNSGPFPPSENNVSLTGIWEGRQTRPLRPNAVVFGCNTRDDCTPPGATGLFRSVCKKYAGHKLPPENLQKIYDEFKARAMFPGSQENICFVEQVKDKGKMEERKDMYDESIVYFEGKHFFLIIKEEYRDKKVTKYVQDMRKRKSDIETAVPESRICKQPRVLMFSHQNLDSGMPASKPANSAAESDFNSPHPVEQTAQTPPNGSRCPTKDDSILYTTAPHVAAQNSKIYVPWQELKDTDVLFHGGVVSDEKSMGNSIFRKEVGLYRGLHLESSTRTNEEQTAIAETFIQTMVELYDCRFLSLCVQKEQWFVMSHKIVLEKVKQALFIPSQLLKEVNDNERIQDYFLMPPPPLNMLDTLRKL